MHNNFTQQVNILFRKGDIDEFKMNLELISVLKSFDWVLEKK